MLWVGLCCVALLVLAEDFTAEELSALEDLRAAGLLDADIEQLLQEDYQDYQDNEVVNKQFSL